MRLSLAPDDAVGLLRERLETSAAGMPGVVFVSGEPGIGKTYVLDLLAHHATAEFVVLRCAGHPAEQRLAFAGLVNLLSRVRDRLAGPHREVLQALLATGQAAGGALSIAVAAHAALTTLADDHPVLMLVDDIQWMDHPSVEALSFALRRMDADRVLAVCAVDGEPLLHGDMIELAPMSEAASRALLRRVAPDLTAAVADRVVAEAAGLPLALIEIPKSLSPAQRTGRQPLPSLVDAGPVLRLAQQRRVARLPELTRQALTVVALDRLTPGELVAALRTMGIDEHALGPAEAAGLVRVTDGRVELAHPTARATVVEQASLAHRQRAHRALAAVLAHDPTRAAPHLDAVAVGTDERTASALGAAAVAAEARGAFEAAGQLWQAAADRSPDQAAASEAAASAAVAFFRAGTVEALRKVLDRLADEVSSSATEKSRWLTVRLLSGLEGVDPRPLRERVADACRGLAAERGARLWTVYALVLAMAGYLTAAGEALDRAQALDPDLPLAERLTADGIRVLLGRPGAGALLLQEAGRLVGPDAMLHTDLPVSPSVVHLAWLDAPEVALDLLLSQRDAIEQTPQPTALALSWAQEAVVLDVLGRWDGADAAFRRAAELADTATLAGLAPIRLRHGRILAARGQADELDRLLAEEAVAALEPTPMYGYTVESARGLLWLGRGEPARALDHLLAAERLRRCMGLAEPAFGAHLGDLFAAAVLVGRQEEVRDALVEAEQRALATGRRSVLAVTARCRAMLSGSDDDFAAACDHHRQAPRPFEVARTHLEWGRARRRARRKSAARVPLHRALEIFTSLRAYPWIEVAERELAACGERRAPARTPLAGLTPREADVALHAARGATNAEIAARLFLSRRTVEYHLANAYRKLDVSSREQLATLLLNDDGRRDTSP